MARGTRVYRDEEKRDSSLRRPTASQERRGKNKSACYVRNDGGGAGFMSQLKLRPPKPTRAFIGAKAPFSARPYAGAEAPAPQNRKPGRKTPYCPYLQS